MKGNVYNVISKMPKGSALHIHSDCCVDNEWVKTLCLDNY